MFGEGKASTSLMSLFIERCQVATEGEFAGQGWPVGCNFFVPSLFCLHSLHVPGSSPQICLPFSFSLEGFGTWGHLCLHQKEGGGHLAYHYVKGDIL